MCRFDVRCFVQFIQILFSRNLSAAHSVKKLIKSYRELKIVYRIVSCVYRYIPTSFCFRIPQKCLMKS